MPTLALAVLAYIASHALRYSRVRMLFREARRSDARLLEAHVSSAWVGALLPYRLGELVRLSQFIAVAGQWRIGAAAYAMEKFFDAVFLLCVSLLALLTASSPFPLGSLVALLAVVITAGIALYATAEGMIEWSARHLLFAPPSPPSLGLLRAVAEARTQMAAVRTTVRRRGLSLAGLTAGIWLLDASAFALAMASPARLSFRAEWTAFLTLLQGMLRGPLGAGGARYAHVVIVVLSLGAAACAVNWARRVVRRLQGRDAARPPYRLSIASSESPDE